MTTAVASTRGAARWFSIAHICALALVAVTNLIAVPTRAMGQTKVAVSAGVGYVDPLPFVQAYKAPTWVASAQFASARHLLIEGTLTGWKHKTLQRNNIEFSSGGVSISRRSTEETRDSKIAATLNVLAVGSIGRVRLISGAGAGPAVIRTTYAENVEACVSTRARLCEPNDPFTTQMSFLAVQVVLGADVILGSRLRTFLTYRQSQPLTAAVGDVSVTAGFSVGLR